MPAATTTAPTYLPDVAQIREFVNWLHDTAIAAAGTWGSNGRLQLLGEHKERTDGAGKPEFGVLDRFLLGEREQMIAAAVRHAAAGWNVYAEPRLIRPGLEKNRGSKTARDTVGVFALVVDVDADKGETAHAFAEPSLVVRSSEPANEHHWFAFTRLLDPDPSGSEKGEATRFGERLRSLGGDANTGNYAQPYRVAGTPNTPSRAKRERGRVDSPTRILRRGSSYAPDAFSALLPGTPEPKQTSAHEGFGDTLTEEGLQAALGKLPAEVLEKIQSAPEKNKRSETWFSLTGSMKAAGLSITEARAVWENFPNSAAEKYLDRPSWPEQLATDWAKLSGPVNVATWFETPAATEDDSTPLWVRQFNERHCVVTVGSKTMFTDFMKSGKVRFVGETALALRYRNMPKQDKKNPFDAWVSHAARYTCVEATFNPNGVPPDVFNLWRGFPPLPGADAVDASGDECERVLWHIRHIVCAGNAEYADYLIRWLAHLVQQPGDKPGVAVILRGGFGVGKDKLGEYVGRMIGPYFASIRSKKQLFGDFNAHLSTALFVQVQELAWQSDKESEGAFKALITSTDTVREVKGGDVETGQLSFVRVLATSNEHWVAPAGENERRLFVLDVSAERMQDHDYFAKLIAEMDGFGPAALLKYLLALDLSDFQVRKVPQTEALREQKLESLTGFDLFWAELLESSGTLKGDEGGSWDGEPMTVEKPEFYHRYERWCRERRALPETMNRVSARLSAATGVPAKDMTVQPRTAEGRVRCYRLPPAQVLRDRWAAKFG